MWIFLSDAMLSIVEDRDDPSCLVVRARLPGDIERTFPEAKIIELKERDYRFRAFLRRELVADRVKKAVLDIRYGNFKDSVPDSARHDAYLGVWDVMHSAQTDAERAEGARHARQR